MLVHSINTSFYTYFAISSLPGKTWSTSNQVKYLEFHCKHLLLYNQTTASRLNTAQLIQLCFWIPRFCYKDYRSHAVNLNVVLGSIRCHVLASLYFTQARWLLLDYSAKHVFFSHNPMKPNIWNTYIENIQLTAQLPYIFLPYMFWVVKRVPSLSLYLSVTWQLTMV